MRAIFRLYLPHVRYPRANIDRQVESNGLPSRWKSKFMVGPTVLASPLMEFKDVGIYPQKRAAAGLEVCVRSFRTPSRLPTRVRSRVCFTTESSRNDFFIARLRVRYGRRVDVLRPRSRHTKSEDVVWKIGSSNRIISFDSCLGVPRGCRRYRSVRSFPDIDSSISARDRDKRISSFQVKPGESRTSDGTLLLFTL